MLGVSRDKLAEKYGLTKSYYQYHFEHHFDNDRRAAVLKSLDPSLPTDPADLERQENANLFNHIVAQRERIHNLMHAAIRHGQWQVVNQFEQTHLKNLQFTAKLLGRLVNRHQIQTINLTLQPDYVEFRQILLEALEDHPDAKLAVLDALHAYERGAKDRHNDPDRQRFIDDGGKPIRTPQVIPDVAGNTGRPKKKGDDE
jgi:hypothetical protein